MRAENKHIAGATKLACLCLTGESFFSSPPFLSSMRSLLFPPILFLFLSMTAPVRAAVPPADATLAQALFTSGKEAMARGDIATACGRFAESLKLDPAVGTLLNLATCEERSGKLSVALEHFTSARTQLGKDDFRVAFTTERIATLSHRVARITVRFVATGPASPPPGARVLRDGVEVDPAALNAPLVVDPGAHVVVVELSGQPPQRTELTLREGEEKVVEVGPKPSPASSSEVAAGPLPARAAAGADTDGTRRTLTFVTAGVGVAGLAVGAVTGLMTLSAASTYRTHCKDGLCDADGLSAASTGRTVSVVSPIAFAVGGVFAIASVYLFVSTPASKPASGSRVVFVPTASREGGGVSLAGAF
jgi:hypothetical protein